MLAQYGVGRDGLARRLADVVRRRRGAVHPGLAGADHRRPGRGRRADRAGSSPSNAEDSKRPLDDPDGRRAPTTGSTPTRSTAASSALTTLTGCQGVNGGGWAHYVGQEKCRPVTGWAQLAFGLDWTRPPRQMIQTAYWYLHTDQFRYDHFGADTLVGHDRAAGSWPG